jgi:hypothetical protein
MHRDSRYEVRPQLVGDELAGEWVRACSAVHRLRLLDKLLRDQVMILSELQQQMMVRLLGKCLNNLFWVELLLRPRSRLRRPVRNLACCCNAACGANCCQLPDGDNPCGDNPCAKAGVCGTPYSAFKGT